MDMVNYDVDAGPLLGTQRKDNLRQNLALAAIIGEQYKPLLFGDIARNSDGVSEETQAIMAQVSAFHAQTMFGGGGDQQGADPAMIAQMQGQVQQQQMQLDQANLYIQQLQFELSSKQAEIQKAVTVEKIKGENQINLEAFKQKGAQTAQQLAIAGQSDIEAQKAETKLTSDLLKMGAQADPVANVRPDYTSVGGMRNNLMP
jgi:hypothetical protein